MEFKEFIHCLNNETRRRILQLLSKKDMSAPEIYEQLGRYAPKYRQSVNKALEILRDGGLVRKYYDDKNKEIRYHLIKRKYLVKIDEMKVK